MKRREFIVGAAVAAALPFAAGAQPAKMATVGVLLVQSPGSEQFRREFPKAMAQLGYVEGRNIRFAFRSDQGDVGRLPQLAADLVRQKVDVIVTWFTPAAHAARNATHDIPVVMALAGNPVETGLVKSLARPGGNVTGIAGVGAELAGKTVELIHDMLPGAHRLAVIANAPDPFSKPFLATVERVGKTVGLAAEPVMIHHDSELEAAFATLAKNRPDAAIVQPSLGLDAPTGLALKYRVAAVSINPEFAEHGGLMGYGVLEADVYRRSALFVEQILKGAKPADLPVEQPTRFELVINLKTAKALGLAVPPLVLARADQVIE